MVGRIYALQSDVDMITQDMQELKRALTTLDFIAHTVKNLWDEQVCQSAQMRRMEKDIAELKTDVVQLKADVAELKADVAHLKTDVAELRTDMAQVKQVVFK